MGNDRITADVDLTAQEIAGLTSVDALAAFFQRLGYDTGKRVALSPEAIGLNDADKSFRTIELLSEDSEGFLRIVFAQVRSLTVKGRTDLVRSLSRFNQDHLVIMTGDFQVLELVLIDKIKRRQQSPATVAAYKPVPRVYAIQRKAPNRLDLRILRRLTCTQRDGLEQYDKLRSVFQAAAYTSEHYQNRALFADHYLDTRLREDVAWADSPNAAFATVKGLAANARERLGHKDESITRQELIEPLFDALGLKCEAAKDAKSTGATADYLLKDADGKLVTVALVYQWDRWLDGPDADDKHTPDENPGASVVSVLEKGQTDWVIVTNGKSWRLYSRKAHSRSTNFYEVDLEAILSASAETDPGEAFRYWWLFFRAQAFQPLGVEQADIRCWLDSVAAGSRDYAKQVEERLKRRVFEHIVPHLAMGFLSDRKARLGVSNKPSEDEREEIREGALTLLYRLLFMLYAESRDLLPVRESAYYAASFKKLKQEVAEAAGVSETDTDEKLKSAYRTDQTRLYDRLQHLFEAMESGDPVLNVPTYNGGLFLTRPDKTDDSREAGISRFLRRNKVPDLFLAQAIDHLSRDPDERSFALVFIDYKSLGVRQLGSIYEGLLEFKLKIAEEDLTTVKEKDKEKVIPLSEVQGKRKKAEVAVRKGEVYLANDKSERRASGSYYTPDHIVEYIVENTVGPILSQKLDDLRSEFRGAEKTYQRHMDNLRAAPGLLPGKWTSKAEFDAAAKAEASAQTYRSHSDLVERFFDLKVLDPAMGSGHFLVQAVDFITDKLLDFLNGFPKDPVSTALERTRQSILESLTEQAISVDPDRLTDVHLLKRHVLKRCIYGVDLNPMAVELARVSLWLDAFTLGAPLSFLDHHLRWGNSLIGATFEDLEKATAGQLFAVNYEPMYRAINNVLTVARLADATAAEVHHSVDAYASVRKALSGYQIILDILAARYFGADEAVTLLKHAHELDLSSEEKFLASLQPADRKMISEVEDVAQQRSFFHWELEFPEIFFGPQPGAERQVERKSGDEAGFDAVVGNPPYVKVVALAHDEIDYWKRAWEAAHKRMDISSLFYELGLRVIRSGGFIGFISSIQFLQGEYGRKLRGLLGKNRVVEILDLRDYQIFDEATTYTGVVVVSKQTPRGARVMKPNAGDSHTLRANWSVEGVIDPSLLTEEPWVLGSDVLGALITRLESSRYSRLDTVATAHAGIVTGCDDLLIFPYAECPFELDSLVPFLESRDLKRWTCNEPSRGVVYPYEEIGHKTQLLGIRRIERQWPKLYRHLMRHKERLAARRDSRTTMGEKGLWYSLVRFSTLALINSRKIVTPGESIRNAFSVSEEGWAYPHARICAITADKIDIWLLTGLLNSSIAQVYLHSKCPAKRGGYRSFSATYLDPFPIPRVSWPEFGDEPDGKIAVSALRDPEAHVVGSDINTTVKVLRSCAWYAAHLSQGVERKTSEILDELPPLPGLKPEDRRTVAKTLISCLDSTGHRRMGSSEADRFAIVEDKLRRERPRLPQNTFSEKSLNALRALYQAQMDLRIRSHQEIAGVERLLDEMSLKLYDLTDSERKCVEEYGQSE